MKHRYNPDRHHRRSIRLRGYDYTRPGLPAPGSARQAGAYYVTIVTRDRKTRFGDVIDGEIHNAGAYGLLAAESVRVWRRDRVFTGVEGSSDV